MERRNRDKLIAWKLLADTKFVGNLAAVAWASFIAPTIPRSTAK